MSEDAKRLTVSVRLGLTIPWSDMGFVKPEISVEGIDPEGDVEAQIEKCLDVASRAFTLIDGRMEVVLSDIVAVDSNQPGLRERLDKFEKGLETAKTNIRTIATKVKEIDRNVSTGATDGKTAS